MEVGILLRLLGSMYLILVLSCPFNIQGREPNLSAFTEKKKGLYSDIYRPISFRLVMMIGTTKLYILMSVLDDLDLYSVDIHSLRNFTVDLDEIHCVATAC